VSAPHEQRGEPVTSRRGFFWVGSERVTGAAGTVPYGRMYVQWEAPPEVRRPYPVVLIHGGGGQGTDYLGTPDGRPGWATQLVEDGYAVYVVDRPGHGRSPLDPAVLGAIGPSFPYEALPAIFVSPPGAHPTAHLHSQWPGSRDPGSDEALDQFMSGTGPMLRDFSAAQALEGRRVAELLDRIGAAIVVANSAGGPCAFLAADARPGLVKALIAVETIGPPFAELPALGVTLSWGLTAAPMAFDPPVSDPAELGREQRALPNLHGVAIAVVSAEASPFVHFDEQIVEFLRGAGCDVERVRLADHGVHGNGHGMMLERNNREALGVLLRWLERRGLA
jgi:pimeloyl-ACP methyl ester carboxylesterase